jgi:hypothetical protein
MKLERAIWIALLMYIAATSAIRIVPMFDPWGFDGDQAQAVWQYWRYAKSGAFPPGDLQTDYAFVMHAPPVWWLAMSTFTTILRSPLWAAKLLNLVSYGGACFFLWRLVAKRSHALVGLAAVVVMLRNNTFFQLTAGGYARSFGPLLVLLFLDAFLARKHLLTLAVLVLQAALYPSVAMPCATAYGIYVVVAGPMRKRLRRMAGMFVAGLLIIACGLYQDLLAPSWWGKVVSVAQALKMPAWGHGGRIDEAPLRPWENEIARQVEVVFLPRGHPLSQLPVQAITWHHALPIAVLVALAVVTTLVMRGRRRSRGEEFSAAPWELLLVFAATIASYFLARALAFKLYFPYRVLAHVIPSLFSIAIPLFAWSLLRRAAVTALVVVLPMLLLFGEGIDIPLSTYGRAQDEIPLYEQVRELPIDAQIAGAIGVMDRLPLFTWHRVFVSRNLAHPFRPGYYAEEERRIRAVYAMIYATDLDDVVAIAKKEHVTHLLFDSAGFVDVDAALFAPVKAQIASQFRANKAKGFALLHVPDDVVVVSADTLRVIDIEKLATDLRVDKARSSSTLSP